MNLGGVHSVIRVTYAQTIIIIGYARIVDLNGVETSFIMIIVKETMSPETVLMTMTTAATTMTTAAMTMMIATTEGDTKEYV